ncbi:MAG: bifunctional hydroxymethylpyrimidine kinase/phosphomethylpyrimidine kinase [Eubacterium sp.]|nr:bifunctional hydroxymethylpyrimidine kinase/phosphomethylpyrimidine kinase [Eubacterium sp.]
MNYQQQEQMIKEGFPDLHTVILGDVMVDEYVTGKVTRISPEAPIPVFHYGSSQRIAGGASNVAHNVAKLGSSVSIMGVVGEDAAGQWLREHLQKAHVDTSGLLSEKCRPTTVKRRFATKSQQLLRVDMEDASPVSDAAAEKWLDLLEQKASRIQAVILSDYKKGVLASPDFIKEVLRICESHQIITAIDSKSPHIEAFAGAGFVKPNNLELEQAVGMKITDEASLDAAGKCYLQRSQAKALLVTRGAKGISVFEQGKERRDYPSNAAQVYDVTGAGDTVISTVTLCIACGMPLEEAAVLGNAAAEVVISKVGTVAVSATELLKKVKENR